MKNVLLAVGLFALCVSAQAEYLYWQISNEVVGEGGAKYDDFAANAANNGALFATVRYGKTGTDWRTWKVGTDVASEGWGSTGEYYGGAMTKEIVGLEKLNYDYAGAIDLNSISDLSTYSFYIEMYKYDAEGGYYVGVAKSEAETYDSLVAQGYIINGTMGDDPTGNYAVWQGSGYSIPEPTSAMLLMIGLSLVGLKRKRT